MQAERAMHITSRLILALSITGALMTCTQTTHGADRDKQIAPGPVLNSISPETGRVPTMTVSLEKLRELGVEVKQLQKATDILCAEVTGQTADSCKAHGDKSAADSSAGQKQETLKVSNHPARKERVDEAMNTIRPMITRMKSNSDEITSGKLGFDCTNELRVKIQPDLEEWRDAINSVAIEMSELENLTQGPTYNNAAIAQTTTSIKDAVKRVEVVRRRVYNAVRKSSKTY